MTGENLDVERPSETADNKNEEQPSAEIESVSAKSSNVQSDAQQVESLSQAPKEEIAAPKDEAENAVVKSDNVSENKVDGPAVEQAEPSVVEADVSTGKGALPLFLSSCTIFDS